MALVCRNVCAILPKITMHGMRSAGVGTRPRDVAAILNVADTILRNAGIPATLAVAAMRT